MRELFLLNNPLVLEISGKDAQRYLNARLTNNIRDLAAGNHCIAGMLNPQGRTEGLFTVSHVRQGEFIAYCDGGDHEKVLAALKRYIVADRVTITVKSPAWGVMHVFSDEKHPEFLNIIKKRSAIIGTDLVGEFNQLSEIEGKQIPLEEQTIRRIRGAVISFPEELNEGTNLAEGNIESAISFTKGCYVGQEVIEKVNAFGKVPRKIIARIEKGKAPPLIDNQRIITSVYDQVNDETLMFVSVAA